MAQKIYLSQERAYLTTVSEADLGLLEHPKWSAL